MTKRLEVFIPKEIEETRVAAIPETVKRMVESDLEVFVESGAGEKASISDDEYKKVGGKIGNLKNYSSADIILSVNPPIIHPSTRKHQLDMIKKNSCWISMLVPNLELDSVKKLIKNKITCFSLNLIPRISRAQKMDALSSQSNIAGYKSVLMAADKLGKIFPLMMTAAGTISPAKVLVMGAGVAGLQAIATAKRLGAQVEVSDVRPIVKEQVESLGATFIDVPFDKDAEDKGGYAKKVSKAFLKRQSEEVSRRITTADVVITTALVPGKKAPVLITEKMVRSMQKGSVIVDLAVEQGGNCELTEEGVVVKHGVTIIGNSNIPGTVPLHASEMYSKNIFAFLSNIIKDSKLNINMKDEIVIGSLLTHQGKVYHKDTEELLKEAK